MKRRNVDKPKSNGARVSIEQELSCEGYFGFGGGASMARRRSRSWAPDEPELYCSAGCPLRDSCWDKHRARVTRLVPEAVESFEALVRECGDDGQEALHRWVVRTDGLLDPYSTMMTGNIEDGAAVANGGQPKDRAQFTLSWPLEPIE